MFVNDNYECQHKDYFTHNFLHDFETLKNKIIFNYSIRDRGEIYETQ